MSERKQYLRNTLTGNIFEVASAARARDYDGSSNRTSDGKPIYVRTTKADWLDYRSKLHPDNPQHLKISGRKNPRVRQSSRHDHFANTIEYGGRKAVINSYSNNPELRASMMKQRKEWAATYPNAKVKTERMAYGDIVAMVAQEREAKAPGDFIGSRALPYNIGKASQEAAPKKPAAKKRAAKKASTKYTSATGKKNPKPRAYIVRAHHEGGKIYYITGWHTLDGVKLDTDRKKADRFSTAKEVEDVLTYLDLRLPKTIKYADGVQA